MSPALRAPALIRPWSAPRARPTLGLMTPPLPQPVLLCEYRDRSGDNRLIATLDMVTLTYSVVLGDDSGATRPVRQHLPALRDARRWALAYRDTVMRS